MIRIILAAAAALALVSAAPVLAEPCKDCPMHKEKVAASEKADKKDPAACPCGAASPKDCKCAEGKCACSKKPEKKAEKKS